MKILLIGSGGRENAFAWKLSQSPLITRLFIAPGNPGTASFGENIALDIHDFSALGKFAIENNIEMVIVGPEGPLVNGVYDFFQQPSLKHISFIGPSAEGAKLEGSKDFAKSFMKKYGIPTASYATFQKDNLEEGLKYLETQTPPYVLKADGLAAGKGVIICSELSEAKQHLKEMIASLRFGEASAKVVVESFLKGIELSVFVLTDGKEYVVLPEAKDYKRIGEGDTGPNTGGMGAVSPVPFANADFMKKVEDRIIFPTIRGIEQEGFAYTGFVFIGLMNVHGDPYVIEYNCRMGDPETEVVIPRIKTDLVWLLQQAANRKLAKTTIELDPRFAVTTMLVSGGYPDDYEKGNPISGLNDLDSPILVFHAGTKLDNEGKLTNHGGRVVALTAYGTSLEAAVSASQSAAATVIWKDVYYRSDIGKDLL